MTRHNCTMLGLGVILSKHRLPNAMRWLSHVQDYDAQTRYKHLSGQKVGSYVGRSQSDLQGNTGLLWVIWRASGLLSASPKLGNGDSALQIMYLPQQKAPLRCYRQEQSFRALTDAQRAAQPRARAPAQIAAQPRLSQDHDVSR